MESNGTAKEENISNKTIQPKKMISKDFALTTISKFLTKLWPQCRPSDLSISQLTGGYVNTIYIVENASIPMKCAIEPHSVLIRIFGGDFIPNKEEVVQFGFHMNSEVEESLIYQQASLSGIGPKIYGFFKGGRVEEYVRSHCLTHHEAALPEFISDLAKAYARFHTIDLPLERGHEWELFSKTVIDQEFFKRPELVATGIDFDLLLSIDFDAEFAMLKKVFYAVESKDVLLQFDNHFLNVLSLEDQEQGKRDLRVMLIDYEIAFYGKRMIDFGGHFNARMLDASGKTTKASGHDYPDEGQRRLFLREYLKEIKLIDPMTFDPKIDNEDHLLLESQVGSLFTSLSMTASMLKMAERFISEPIIFTLCEVLGKFYMKKKEELKNTYKFLPFNDMTNES